LVWWIIGMALVACYSVYIYRHFAGKVKMANGEEGY
jgi:cytochrome bd-type quinol oxidase subunit 2